MLAVKRVHQGRYVSRPDAAWSFRRVGGSWLMERGGVSESFGTLRDARVRAAALDAEASARSRPSTSPEVERLTIRRVREHRDHHVAEDERGRVMSTGRLSDVADAIVKHWPHANVVMAS